LVRVFYFGASCVGGFNFKCEGYKIIIDGSVWANIVEFKLEGEFASSRLENFKKIYVYLYLNV